MTIAATVRPTYEVSMQSLLIETFLECSEKIAQGDTDEVIVVTKSVHGIREHIIVPQLSLRDKLDQYLMTYTKDLKLATDNNIRIIAFASVSLQDIPSYIKEVF